MNRKVINGVAALCMAGMLLEPVMTVNAEELLTAGVGDLFSSELTEDQYKNRKGSRRHQMGIYGAWDLQRGRE